MEVFSSQQKKSYSPKITSPNKIKEKYTDLRNKPTIFMINGIIVDGDYDNYLVDENYILDIIVDEIKNAKEIIDIDLIKIRTKTKENIEKSKEIRIR